MVPLTPLAFSEYGAEGAAGVLLRLRRHAGHLLRNDRGPDFDPDWRVKIGYSGAVRVEDSPEARRAFNEHYASDALLQGLGLSGVPWGAPWMALAASVAKWADGALRHIEKLEADLQRTGADLADKETLLARSRYGEAVMTSTLAEERAGRAAEREGASRAAQEAAEQVRALTEDLRLARADAREARAAEAAWRATAGAATDALYILRVALRIPEGDFRDLPAARSGG